MSSGSFALRFVALAVMAWASTALAADSTSTAVGEAAPEAAPPEEHHPSAALLQRITASAGGHDAVTKSRGLHVRARTLPLIEGASSTLRYTFSFDPYLQEEVRSATGAEIRSLLGNLVKVSGSEKSAKKSVAPEVAEDIRYRFHELAAPLELARTWADSLAELGSSPEGWTRLARRFGKERLAYDVDPATGALLRVSRLGDADEPTVSIELDDYRHVDGVAYPFRWTTVIEGRAVLETIVERVTPVEAAEAHEFYEGHGM